MRKIRADTWLQPLLYLPLFCCKIHFDTFRYIFYQKIIVTFSPIHSLKYFDVATEKDVKLYPVLCSAYRGS